MIDVTEKVNDVLSAVFDNFYNGMPEFADDEEPEAYAAYFVREKPDNFASGIYHAKSYWVSVSIISLAYDRELYEQTEKAFTHAGFIYAGGTDVSGYERSSAYPHRYQYSQEYLISIDLEE